MRTPPLSVSHFPQLFGFHVRSMGLQVAPEAGGPQPLRVVMPRDQFMGVSSVSTGLDLSDTAGLSSYWNPSFIEVDTLSQQGQPFPWSSEIGFSDLVGKKPHVKFSSDLKASVRLLGFPQHGLQARSLNSGVAVDRMGTVLREEMFMVRDLPDGNTLLSVAIVDPSFFFFGIEGLFETALGRAANPDSFSMMHGRLKPFLSLSPGISMPTVTLAMTVNQDGEVISVGVNLTQSRVDAAIDFQTAEEHLAVGGIGLPQVLRDGERLAQSLEVTRRYRHRPAKEYRSDGMIEAFMQTANEQMAWFFREHGIPGLFRSRKSPVTGVRVDVSSPDAQRLSYKDWNPYLRITSPYRHLDNLINMLQLVAFLQARDRGVSPVYPFTYEQLYALGAYATVWENHGSFFHRLERPRLTAETVTLPIDPPFCNIVSLPAGYLRAYPTEYLVWGMCRSPHIREWPEAFVNTLCERISSEGAPFAALHQIICMDTSSSDDWERVQWACIDWLRASRSQRRFALPWTYLNMGSVKIKTRRCFRVIVKIDGNRYTTREPVIARVSAEGKRAAFAELFSAYSSGDLCLLRESTTFADALEAFDPYPELQRVTREDIQGFSPNQLGEYLGYLAGLEDIDAGLLNAANAKLHEYRKVASLVYTVLFEIESDHPAWPLISMSVRSYVSDLAMAAEVRELCDHRKHPWLPVRRERHAEGGFSYYRIVVDIDGRRMTMADPVIVRRGALPYSQTKQEIAARFLQDYLSGDLVDAREATSHRAKILEGPAVFNHDPDTVTAADIRRFEADELMVYFEYLFGLDDPPQDLLDACYESVQDYHDIANLIHAILFVQEHEHPGWHKIVDWAKGCVRDPKVARHVQIVVKGTSFPWTNRRVEVCKVSSSMYVSRAVVEIGGKLYTTDPVTRDRKKPAMREAAAQTTIGYIDDGLHPYDEVRSLGDIGRASVTQGFLDQQQHHTAADVAGFNVIQFIDYLVYVSRLPHIPDDVYEVCLQKLDEYKESRTDLIHFVLFELRGESSDWQRIFAVAKDHVAAKQNIALDVYRMVKKSGQPLAQRDVITHREDGVFYSRVVVEIDGKLYTTAHQAEDANSSTSVEEAKQMLLARYLDDELVPHAQEDGDEFS